VVDYGAELHRHRFDRRPDGRDRQGHRRQVLDQAHESTVGERVMGDEKRHECHAKAGDRHIAYRLAVIGGDPSVHGQADCAALVFDELPDLRRLDIEIADAGVLDQFVKAGRSAAAGDIVRTGNDDTGVLAQLARDQSMTISRSG
jgi:hypothetical protein